jgi:hypothetical protein
MSILHRRRQARETAAARVAGVKRKSTPAEYSRASNSKPVDADVKARTWIDPEAPVVKPPRKTKR